MNEIIWLVLMVVFLVVEAACPIHLVSIWFAAGSLIAMFATMLGAQLWLQITLFLLVSGGLLVCLWPFVRRFLNPGRSATNVDSVIGAQGYVTAPIDNISATGQVKLGGMFWSARSTGGQNIPKGTLVRVDKIEGVKVFVSEVKAEVSV